MTPLDQNVSVIFANSLLIVLEEFDTETYTWRLVIVQNFYKLWQFFYLILWVQNVSITLDQNMSCGQNVSISPPQVFILLYTDIYIYI